MKYEAPNTKHQIRIGQRGFTVLESIVAIFVLSLSISGAFTAIQQSLSQSIIAKDEVKAFYLAQEAIEIIRNKRDANQLIRINTGTGHWLRGIAENGADPCYFNPSPDFPKVCRVDAFDLSLNYCGSNAWGSCPLLNQDQDTNLSNPTAYLYGYQTGPTWKPTNFRREIQIERVQNDASGNPIEIAVTVRISWTKGSLLLPFVFEAKTHLFNWANVP